MSPTTLVNVNGVGVTLFQLIQWKHALRLEEAGLKLSRGRSVSAHVKKTFGFPRNTKRSVLVKWLDSVLDALTTT
jgi:hypothetical protein